MKTKMKNTSILLVEEFHKIFNHPISDEINIPKEEIYNFRINFLKEELTELEKAIEENNLKEFCDGICDFQYVLDGFSLITGLKKIIMNEDYMIPTVESEIKIQSKDLLMIIERLKSSLVGINASCIENDTDSFTELMMYMQYQVYLFIFKSGLNNLFEQLINEVHRSNMTKACRSQTEAEETISSMPEVDCITEKIGEYIIVKRKSDNKVMKNINYSKVDFSKILS